jgi:hypothetical protein
MASVDTAWSSGASGIAFDAETATRLRQIANADATSSFIGAFLSSQICRDAAISTVQKIRRPVNGKRALPVTAVPAAPVPAVMPTPVAAMPVPVPMMSPADLFGLQMLNFSL